jgi:hypothetical protein
VGELGSSGLAYSPLGGLGPEWRFEGSGDFLDDSRTQFLIENTSGAVYVGEVGWNGKATYTAAGGLGPEWKFVGAGDFLGLGHAQFLIENTSGAVDVGTVGAGGGVSYVKVAALGPEWKFVGAGDFYGDGKTDFMIENSAGAVAIGEVGAGNQVSYQVLGALGPEWSFEGVGDFLDATQIDKSGQFLIENTSGQVDVGSVGWTVINDSYQQILTYTPVAALGPEWKFVGVGDYSGTGVASFLIENTSGAVFTGAVVGGRAQYTAVAGLGPEWSFEG